MEITVGISQLKVSADANETLVTYSLGTCLGMTIYDPAVKVGGMIHAQLPLSAINRDKALEMPAMFIDTGVPMLFEKAVSLGASMKRMIVKIAGCNISGENSRIFRIGERNHIMIRKLLWKNGIFISAEDIGGSFSRTMRLEIAAGAVTITANGSNTRI